MASITYSSTKAQIWNAYKALLKDKKQVEKDLVQARKARPAAVPKPAAAPKRQPVTTPERVDIAAIISSLEGLQDGFRQAVGEMEGDLVHEASRLAELRVAADSLVEKLQNEHGLDVEEGTLDTLVTQAVQAAEAADEAHETRSTAHRELMAERKASWTAEVALHKATITERNADRSKAVRREEAEYSYQLERTRSEAADADAQRRKAQEKALAEFEAETRQAWTDRHEALLARETELADLEKKNEAFPAELMAAIDKAKKEGLGIARKQAGTRARMASQAIEARKQLSAERIEALEATIGTQKARIERLGAQLEAALQQAQQLAVKALEGAANATSFKAVREIAMEQARNTKNGK